MKIVYGIIKFIMNKEVKSSDLEKLRGNMIKMYKENVKIHNHMDDGKSLYIFPEFQYKIINGKLSIMLFNDNINFLFKTYSEIESLTFEKKIFKVQKDIQIKEYDIKYTNDKYYSYEFVSYYLPFNQENYKKYSEGYYTIEKALINNILEFLKALKIYLNKDMQLNVKNVYIVKESYVISKGVKFKGIKCKFDINIDLPSYISLGKRKSVGYGVIKKI